MWWTHAHFPRIDGGDLEPSWIDGALLSRADSGSIHWGTQAPRSYVRGAVYTQAGGIVEASQRAGGLDGDLVLSVNPAHLTAGERKDALAGSSAGNWLYAGHWMPGFGHFVVETLPMLWPLVTGGYSIDSVVAHRFTSTGRYQWQFDLMAGLLGSREIQIIDDAPAAYDRLLVPPRPYRYERAISDVAAAVWDELAENLTGGQQGHGRRVYLSRTHFDAALVAADVSSRGYANAEQVDAFFRARGFDVIYPEELPIAEQVAAVRDAEVIVGQSGSALHLAAFMRAGKVLEIGDRRIRAHPVGTQMAIAATKRQVIAQIPFQEEGDNALDLDRLKGYLEMLDVA